VGRLIAHIIDRVAIFYRVHELLFGCVGRHHNRVQDVSIETKGMLSTFLKFADIHIQTAGTNRDFYFRQVPHADQAKDAILQECDHYMCSLRGEPDRHHDDVPRSGL